MPFLSPPKELMTSSYESCAMILKQFESKKFWSLCTLKPDIHLKLFIKHDPYFASISLSNDQNDLSTKRKSSCLLLARWHATYPPKLSP